MKAIENPFDPWTSFGQLMAAVSVTLLAIAFLTFQVRSEVWRNDILKQVVAISTLIELSAPLFFYLIALFPSHPWVAAGYVVGGAGYLLIATHVGLFVHHRNVADAFDRRQVFGAAILFLTFSLLFWWHSIFVKSVVLVWMLFSGLWEAWYFLRVPVPAE
jgi:hypothetical protein